MNLDNITFTSLENFYLTRSKNVNGEITLSGDFPGFSKNNLDVYVENEEILVLTSLKRGYVFFGNRYDITGYEVKKVSIVDGVLSVVLTKYAPDKNRVKIEVTD